MTFNRKTHVKKCTLFDFYGLVTKIASDIECVYRLHHRLCSAMPLHGQVAITKFKNKKINSEGLFRFSTKEPHNYAETQDKSELIYRTLTESFKGL